MRARNLKPGFFKNEDLAALPPLTRILYEGLWCLADRAGRLEDRPQRIKAEVLPYDSCDVGNMITELEQAGFLKRYLVQNVPVIWLPTFLTHQWPHKSEKESRIVPYNQPPLDKNRSSTEVAHLNPSSLNPSSLNPSSLNPYKDSEKRGAAEKPPRDGPSPDQDVPTPAAAGDHRPPAAAKASPSRRPATPLQKVILAFKRLSDIPAEDKEWDRTYFPRFTRAANELLAYFGGDWRAAVDCEQYVIEKMKQLGRSFTLETVIKHAAEFKNKLAKTDA